MQGSKLYVGNLPYAIDESELQGLFSTYGEVKQITIIAGKGFGFVEMVNSEDAEKAKNGLNGTDLKGRQLKIDEARPMKERSDKRDFKRY
ncbi:MAG: RNA-binding protein [Candidatus Firestonebacteria bacterium]